MSYSKKPKIGIIRFSALGDIAASTPVLRACKKKPIIITSKIGYDFLKDEFDSFIILEDKTIPSVIKLIFNIRKEKFDYLIALQTNDRTKLISTLSNSKKIVNSMKINKNQQATKIFYDIVNQTDYVASLDLTFVLKAKTYIVLNCGSSSKWLSKRLPVEKWQEFSKLLTEKYNLPFVLTGDKSEVDYVTSIANKLYGRVEVIAGQTTIQDLKKVLTSAFLTVSTDSAAMHISAVQKTPTIGIFGPTNWIKASPYGPWSIGIYDESFYKDGMPPSKSIEKIDNYYANINIDKALEKISDFLN